MSAYRALAPAKVNLGLFVGPVRAQDGRHELVTVMQAISLADVLTLEPAGRGAERDELVCAGVPGGPEDNLAWRALQAFRAATALRIRASPSLASRARGPRIARIRMWSESLYRSKSSSQALASPATHRLISFCSARGLDDNGSRRSSDAVAIGARLDRHSIRDLLFIPR